MQDHWIIAQNRTIFHFLFSICHLLFAANPAHLIVGSENSK